MGAKIIEYIDTLILIIVAIISIGIAIGDFVGALDSLIWIKSRLTTMLLLILGLISIHLITNNFTLKKKLEKQDLNLVKSKDEIIDLLKSESNKDEVTIIVNEIWRNQENWVLKLFQEIEKTKFTTKNKNQINLYLDRIFSGLLKGSFLQNNLIYPWDITLSAINNKDGYFLFHPRNSNINTDKTKNEPFKRILKEKSGKFLWCNEYFSEQFAIAFNDEVNFKIEPGAINRFTMIFFREFPKLNAIIVFESHLNLIHKLPKKIDREEVRMYK